jgi:hypothetical protein
MIFSPPPKENQRQYEVQISLKDILQDQDCLDHLGKGAFAKVLKYKNPKTGKSYAVKQMGKGKLKQLGN